MSGPPPYDINGNQYCLSSADLDVAGNTIIGASEIKCGEKLEPGEVEGTSAVPVGYTTGPWSGNGSLKLALSEALALKAKLGNQWGTVVWTGTFTWTEVNGPGVMTLEILGARFTTTDLDGGDRSKPATDALGFMLLQPSKWNGAKIVEPNSGSAGFGGFSVSSTI
jgi:hypothetical protein